jgi:catechol 2,3-dioxygenase-like lactoylglutathione lyase family enzyme
MSQKTTSRITGIHTIAVPVTDQDTSLQFFTDKLGFEKRMDAEFGPGRRWIEVAPPGAETTVALALPGQDFQPAIETGIRFYTDDADAEHADLRARGVDVDAEVMRFGPQVPPMFYFRDPDGNRFVIVEGR